MCCINEITRTLFFDENGRIKDRCIYPESSPALKKPSPPPPPMDRILREGEEPRKPKNYR
jgi:hypothetical protein